MRVKVGKWAAGMAVVALLVGGGCYLAGWWGVSASKETAATPVAPSNSGTISNVESPVPGLSAEAEREQRESILAEQTRTFDLEMVDFFKQVATAHKDGNQGDNLGDNQGGINGGINGGNTGDKIEWRRYISASPSPNEADRQRNRALWDKFVSLCQKSQELSVPNLRRMRYYMMFFDVDSFNVTPEQRAVLPKGDEWDEVPFGYITEVVTPAWYFEYEPVCYEYDCNTEKALKDLPPHLRELMATEEYREENGVLQIRPKPTQGVWHLESFTQANAEKYGRDLLRVISKHMDLKGKDWAEIGAGSGQYLSLFRMAIGPDAKLWAGELDVFTRDVLKYCAQGTNAVIYRNYPSDCNCGENSFDILTMSGVHLGSFNLPKSGSGVDSNFLTWIRSMSKALRPGGILVVQDGNWDLVERHMDRFIEEAGFKKIDDVTNKELDTFYWVFQVKK